MSLADDHAALMAELELELVPDPPDLEAALELAPDHPDRFHITGPRQAEWALLKIAQAERRHEELLEVVEAERDRIDHFAAGARAERDRAVEFFEGLLAEWHRTETVEPALEAAMPKARAELGEGAPEGAVLAAAWAKVRGKTAKLPAGEVAARRTADRVTFPADLEAERREEFTAWAAAEVPELVRVKREPDLRAVAAAVAAGEELVRMGQTIARLEPEVAEASLALLAELERARADAGEPTVALLVDDAGAVFTLEGERVPHLELVRGKITYSAKPAR